ncbi:MAG: extracellular solute-binding protein [Phycisphaerales bacterium]
MNDLSRREMLRLGLAGTAGLIALPVASCDHRASAGEVVLYSSVDTDFLRAVVQKFESQSGLTVRMVGDTEATKTTGLVQRLLAERAAPLADVWWSSEVLGTIKLAREGVLAPMRSPALDAEFGPAGWPARLRGAGDLWHAFAGRPRVLVHNTQLLSPCPPDLEQVLASGKRFAMARPQFGTTRGHMAWFAALAPGSVEGGLEGLLQRMKNANVLICDGNATVVRAVSRGEAVAGMTDLDDVVAGQRNGWPVAEVYHGPLGKGDVSVAGWPVLPNSVALVKGGKNPDGARRLFEYLLSGPVEKMLAAGDSRNWPVRPAVAEKFPGLVRAEADFPDWTTVERFVEPAMAAAERILGP